MINFLITANPLIFVGYVRNVRKACNRLKLDGYRISLTKKKNKSIVKVFRIKMVKKTSFFQKTICP